MIVSNPQQRCRGLARGRHGLWDNPESETPPSLGPGVLSSGWCPLPSSEGSYIHPYTHQERRGSMKTAESGSPPPSSPMSLEGADPESRAWAPKRSSRKGSGVPGSSWVPKAPRKHSISPRPAQGSSEACARMACRAPLAVPTHLQTEQQLLPASGSGHSCLLSHPALLPLPPFPQGLCHNGSGWYVHVWYTRLRTDAQAPPSPAGGREAPVLWGGCPQAPPPTPSPTGLAKAMPCPS